MEKSARAFPTISVITPTFNRGAFLPGLHKALVEQAYPCLEWIVVDDGSTDNTRAIIEELRLASPVPIKYISQPNQGKHVALNAGVELARGDFVALWDSDDLPLREAFATAIAEWVRTPEGDRERVSTITGLCCDAEGRVLGRRFPHPFAMIFDFGLQLKLRGEGERWGLNRRDVLAAFPFPSFPNERFLVEGVVWNRIAQHYGTLFIDRPLSVARYQSDGLTANMMDTRCRSPIGSLLYYVELSAWHPSLLGRLIARLNAARFFLHAAMLGRRQLAREVVAEAGIAGMFMVSLLMPAGGLLFIADRLSLHIRARRGPLSL